MCLGVAHGLVAGALGGVVGNGVGLTIGTFLFVGVVLDGLNMLCLVHIDFESDSSIDCECEASAETVYGSSN